MNDELAETIRVVLEYELDPDSGSTEDDAKAIAAAIRVKWPWIDWPCINQVHDARGQFGVVIWDSHIKTCGHAQPDDPTPADERGVDAEAIKMWREHDKHS